VIVLAFDRPLSPDAAERIRERFDEAIQSGKVIVVSECKVLSDGPSNQGYVELADGSVIFIPQGLTKQELLEAVRLACGCGTDA
jgi:hypothetical protein